ncbi:hypothetical protein FACS1894141_2510 [Spirochaetia bacterium]|nr:hypothetical protein FACS1894141_2510 [Spirochaetia bacterium]
MNMAKRLYPDEIWRNGSEVAAEFSPEQKWWKNITHIYVADSRPRWNKQDRETLEKELIQAKILAEQGHTVYLLPKHEGADAIVDDLLVEFKRITGGIDRVETRFRESRKQSENVFLNIDNPALSRNDVQAKIRSALLDKYYTGGTKGLAIVYIKQTQRLYYWALKDIIKKIPAKKTGQATENPAPEGSRIGK